MKKNRTDPHVGYREVYTVQQSGLVLYVDRRLIDPDFPFETSGPYLPVNTEPSISSKIDKYLNPPTPKNVLFFGNVELLRRPDITERGPEKKQLVKKTEPLEYVDLGEL